MRTGEAVEWTLHVCALLAALPVGTALPASRLAEFYALPPAYLAKHLQQLSAARIVEATKGRSGGYRLSRPPRDITLLEIVEAVEGRESIFRCTEIRRQGPSAAASTSVVPVCGIARAMGRAETAWREELRAQTVADIAATMTTDVSEEQKARAWRWFQQVARTRKGRGTVP